MKVDNFGEFTTILKKENNLNIFLPESDEYAKILPTAYENFKLVDGLRHIRNTVSPKYKPSKFIKYDGDYKELDWDNGHFERLEDPNVMMIDLDKNSRRLRLLFQNHMFLIYDFKNADYTVADMKIVLNPILQCLFKQPDVLFVFVFLTRIKNTFMGLEIIYFSADKTTKDFDKLLPIIHSNIHQPKAFTYKLVEYNFWLHRVINYFYHSNLALKKTFGMLAFPTKSLENFSNFNAEFKFDDGKNIHSKISTNMTIDIFTHFADYEEKIMNKDFNKILGIDNQIILSLEDSVLLKNDNIGNIDYSKYK